jgi:hypothetical protein
MSTEQRMRCLLGAALRAEEEGDARTAHTLRPMAGESWPLGGSRKSDQVRAGWTSPAVGCCAE